MGYFLKNRTVTFEDLRKAIDNEGKRVYSEELLQEIENRHLDYLYNLDLVDRNNKDFMEPLLYAVKNSVLNTYEVYKYYGEELQKQDLTIATEIVINEPEVLEDTIISNKPATVLYLVDYNSEIIMYISDDLKKDGEFVEKICETREEEAIKYIAKECDISEVLEDNPDLANNPDFMKEAIKNDTEALSYLSSDLKDDYEFMKEVSDNHEAIDYVVENLEEFGIKGLSGTKDALIEKLSDEAIVGFEEEQKKVRKQIEEHSSDDSELEELLKRDKQLQRHVKFFERIKNGEVDPVRAAKLMDKMCANLDPEYRKEIKKVLKLDETILENQKESEEKDEKTTEENTANEDRVVVSDKKITPINIEETTKNASLEGVEQETGVIRKTIETERIQESSEIVKDTQEGGEMGEVADD